jgi:hypothetical protein
VAKGGSVPGFLAQLGLLPQQLWSLNFALNYGTLNKIDTLDIMYQLAVDILEPAFAAAFAGAVAPPLPAPRPELADRLVGLYSFFDGPSPATALEVTVATDGSLRAFLMGAPFLLTFHAQDAGSAAFSLHQLPTGEHPVSCIMRTMSAIDGSAVTFLLPAVGHSTALQAGDAFSTPAYPYLGPAPK